MKSRSWLFLVLIPTIISLLFVALLNFIVDPAFHYRKPTGKYVICNERYQNDGMQKHFDYDTIIVGTSMTENFKSSDVDKVFDVHSIKTPYSGGTYREINDAVITSINNNDDLRVVIRSLDLNKARLDVDSMTYDNYPTYLYDEKNFNDINYLLNGEIFVELTSQFLLYSIAGRDSTTFDEYANWNDSSVFGKDSVLSKYERPPKCCDMNYFSEKEIDTIRTNVEINVVKTTKDNPDIDFYYFLPPYSVIYWDELVREGNLMEEIEVQRIIIEELIDIKNCHLYSWCDNVALVCDLDNYKDVFHYGEWINTDMINWMKDGTGELTKENYETYLNRLEEIYTDYDYDSIFR